MTAHAHPDDDRLLDLVNGLLPPTVRAESLLHVGSCHECAARLRDVAAIHARAHSLAIDALGRAAAAPEVDDVRVGDDRVGSSDRPSHAAPRVLRLPARRGSRPIPLALAAAAAIMIVGVGVYIGTLPRLAAHRPGLVAWLPAPQTGVVTRDSIKVAADPRLAEGLAAYRKHDAATAKRLLSVASAEGPLEQVRLLYLGNSRLQLGEFAPALADLRAIDLDQVPEPWRSEAMWSTAVAFQGVGRGREADSLMNVLAARPDAIGDRARRALSDRAPAR